MRLLLITQDFPPDVGGTQTYAFELARRFARKCESFAVVAPQRPGAAETDAALPFEVVRVRASYDLLSIAALGPLLTRGRRFDASFHVQWPTALAALLTRRFGWPRRVFIAAHGREILLRPFSQIPVLDRLYERARRQALTKSDGLFPVSRYTGELLHRAGTSPERIDIVHNGTDPQRFAPRDATLLRDRLGLGSRPVVLTVARLVSRKGIDSVIVALPRIAQAVPEVQYLVVGDGPDRARLQALAGEQGVAERVLFLGKIAPDLLPLCYSTCDLFVLPARHAPPDVEGFGIVFLEANAAERPVVGTRTAGIPDAIRHGETGLLVEPDDPQALATTIIRLLKDPALSRRLGRQGRQRVIREATWDHIADRLYTAMQARLT